MRHVILGANTIIGASIARLLSRIEGEVVVCCDPNGFPPSDVPNPDLIIKQADVIDPYSLMEIMEEGDIIYHTQILKNENTDLEEADFVHRIGIINVLGVANQKLVDKIITFIPQALGWSIPRSSTETTPQSNPSPYQISLRNMLEVIEKYWKKENFGWSNENLDMLEDAIDGIVNPDFTDEKLQESNDKEDEKTNNKQNTPPIETVENTSGPSLGMPAGISLPSNIQTPQLGPNLGNVENDDQTKPNLTSPKPPTLANKNQEQNEQNKNQNDPENTHQQENDNDQITDLADSEKEIENQDDLYKVPLVVARIARMIGPHEKAVTIPFCQAIRLQRMKTIGKYNQPISWIHPLDAARAMIFSVDLPADQYLFNGFINTPREVLSMFDKTNFSTIKIKSTPLIFSRLKFKIKKILAHIGFNVHLDYFSQYALTTAQSFSDEKVRLEFNWKESYDLEKTIKDALEWFVNHVL